MTRSEWHISKSEATGSEGMVIADHPLAAEAGADILRRGGNAVDAAVAAAFTAAVVLPFLCGIGGVAAAVVHIAQTARTVVIDGSGLAPHRARGDMFELTHGTGGIYAWPATKGNANNVGHRAAGVPGAVACLLDALERYGTIDRAAALARATDLAAGGYDIDWYQALLTASCADRLWPNVEAKRTYFLAGGMPLRPPLGLEPGHRLVQHDLAVTLRRIARGGADEFYRGETARAIASDMAEHGGLLDAEDLAAYRARELEPLTSAYRDVELRTLPGCGGGITVVEALNILEGFDLAALEQGGAVELHLVAEALRRAFQDRFAYLADPAQVDAPFAEVASKGFAAERRRTIESGKADPGASAGTLAARSAPSAIPAADHTTHISVVDRERNVVALTFTLGQAYGSGVVPRGTGVVLANVMTWFDPRPGRVNSVAPGKRTLWAPAPAIVFREGSPWMAAGAPGGRRIMSAVVQAIVNSVDHRDAPQDAVNRLRVHAEGRVTELDARTPEATRETLRGMGHELALRDETFASMFFGVPQAIRIDGDGTLRGGVNRLKLSTAIGVGAA